MSIIWRTRSGAKSVVKMISNVTMAAFLSSPLYAQSDTPPEILKLVARDFITDVDLFGKSVDVDGDTAVIGADNAAYVFVREGER